MDYMHVAAKSMENPRARSLPSCTEVAGSAPSVEALIIGANGIESGTFEALIYEVAFTTAFIEAEDTEGKGEDEYEGDFVSPA